MKTCTECKQSLPMALFAKDKTKTDGYKTQCRSCRNPKQVQARREASAAKVAAEKAQRLEREARGRALRSLVELHRRDFNRLLSNYRLQLDAAPEATWVEIT